MDDTTLKVALAGLLHDIGKFLERAGYDPGSEFLERNANLYQPVYKGHYSHRHAIYTAAFVEKYGASLPAQFSTKGWGSEESFENLAAMHHKPETPLQWTIAMGDRIASGMDRHEFDQYNESVEPKDHVKTRLVPILEQVHRPEAAAPVWRYPLAPMTADGIFPEPPNAGLRRDPEEEYALLMAGFSRELSRLAHRKENLALWFEHFESLLREYCAHVPATSVGSVGVHDVSLFDHSLATAALAAALYRYHSETDTLTEEAIRDEAPSKFLLVTGDFYGIQDFIFNEGGDTSQGRAKMLRGRSLMVSLLSELTAMNLCEELGLPQTSVVLNAAGKFTIICQNTTAARAAVEKTGRAINRWLLEHFYGENAIGLSTVGAAPRDFLRGNFRMLWERVGAAVEFRKFSRFDVEQLGAVPGYLDAFRNDLDPPLCPFCGKRPSVPGAMPSLIRESRDSCATCRDQIFLGLHVVRRGERLAITKPDAAIHGQRLLAPIFGRYQVFFASGDLNEMAHDGSLLRYGDIGLEPAKGGRITHMWIGGYVPTYGEGERVNPLLADRAAGTESGEGMLDETIPGAAKNFEDLAAAALVPDGAGGFRGLEALGVLKADVDNLGDIFATGLSKALTLSRLATLSRQINAFFTLAVPHRLASDERFSDIYTVFTGGDDLFLIGPWNRIADFAVQLQAEFSRYTCRNPLVTISAGIGLHKPGEPLRLLSETAEEALRAAKEGDGDGRKNRLTVFGETVPWEEMPELLSIRDQLAAWLQKGWVAKGMLYRFNAFQEMAGRERKLKKANGITMEEIDACLWQSRFRYTVARNTARGRSEPERRRATEEVLQVADWLSRFDAKLKVPLWRLLYEAR